MKTLNRTKEEFLLDLLDETKRLITAWYVVKEQGIANFREILPPEHQHHAKHAADELYEEIAASLLTSLMLVMGYRIPGTDLYRLGDYVELCDWLGEKEENGEQRWEDG
jgi:hypothetical protein